MGVVKDTIVDRSAVPVKLEFEIKGKKIIVTSDQIHQLLTDLSNVSRGKTDNLESFCSINQEFKEFVDEYYPDTEPSGDLKTFNKIIFALDWFVQETLAN